jgi:hypothetical protein
VSDKPSKVETEDIPRILAAVKTAVDSRQTCRIVIDVAENGGVIGIQLESKKKFK